MSSLWPADIGHVDVKTPAAILREQASLLGDKTQNIVTAKVKKGESREDPFYYTFYLVASSYSYQYKLFAISYGFKYYPVQFYVEEDIKELLSGYMSKSLKQESQGPTANSEEEFLEIVGKIFNAEKTKRIINALIAESET